MMSVETDPQKPTAMRYVEAVGLLVLAALLAALPIGFLYNNKTLDTAEFAIMCVPLLLPSVLVAGAVKKLVSPVRYSMHMPLVAASAFIYLGVLVLFPGFYSARAQGHLYGCKKNLHTISKALDSYAQDNGHIPRSIDELKPRYLKAIPTCPAAGRDTYSAGYTAVVDDLHPENDCYTYYCSGDYHKKRSVPLNYPQFSRTHQLIEKP